MAVALILGVAATAGAQQQPPTKRDTTRATARDTTARDSTLRDATARRGARRGTARTPRAGGEVSRDSAMRNTGLRVRKDEGAARATPASDVSRVPASPTTSPTTTPNPTSAVPSTTPPSTTPPSTTMPSTTPSMTPSPTTSPMPSAMPSATADAATSALVTSLQTDAHALALLHEANVGEIEVSRRAQTQARDSAVRAYATTMVTEHGALDQQATALAQQAGITPALPDSQLPRLQSSELTALPTPTAAEPAGTPPTGDAAFDKAYIDGQVAAHTRTLAIVDAAIGKAQDATLRTMLQDRVRPTVAAHLAAARQLQQRLGTR